jgi:two-component system invasion response regulator UvrY
MPREAQGTETPGVTHSPAPDPGGPVRVLIVDGDRRVRRSLAGLIELAEGLTCCGMAEDAAAALTCLEQAPADVCLIDPRSSEADCGLELLAEMRRRWPQLGIVAMSFVDASADPCLDGGADAFVAKSGQPDALVDALRTVAAQRTDHGDLPNGGSARGAHRPLA